MNDPVLQILLEKIRSFFANEPTLPDEPVTIKTLSPFEAIGNPGDWDFPLLRGKEILLQAEFRSSFGQAFTGNPSAFEGEIGNLVNLDFSCLENRTVLIAAFNALLRDQKLVTNTVHCRDSEPEVCGRKIAAYLDEQYSPVKIGIAGYQPALISSLADCFGSHKIKVTDLSTANIGKDYKGIKIRDAITDTDSLIAECDLLLVTGSVFVNATAEPFYRAFREGKAIYFFGTSVTGIAKTLGLPHLCPLGS